MRIRIMRKLVTIPAVTALGLSMAAHSSETETQLASLESGNGAWLNPVVVTATTTEQRSTDSLTSISVVDRDSIRRQQPREFHELLRGRPGVDVAGNGAFGKATSLFIRGMNNSQSLLLVDGIRMGSATAGAPSWQYLPPSLIDRAEVLRGPRGSVYGADALGGVVQVFTPEGHGEPQPWAEAAGGSFGTHQYGGGVQGRSGDTRYSLGASHFHTDGIALREGGERKGYYNSSAVARLSHDFGDNSSLGLTSLHSQGRTEYIGGKTDFVHQALGSRLDFSPVDNWDSQISLSQSRDEAENIDDAGARSRFDTRRQMLRWQNSLYAGDHEFLLGADYMDDQVDSTTQFEEDSRSNTGSFAQALLDFDPVSLELALRHDDNEAYGSETTGSFAFGYRLDEAHRVRLSWGEGFKAPSFNDLYFPGFSNPDLAPEESESVEVGVTGHYDRWFWDAVAYRTDVDNLIQLAVVDGMTIPENVAEARIEGAEVGAGADLGDWTLYGAATYVDPEDRMTGNRLPRRAKQSLRLEVDRALGEWSLGATVIAQGHRYNDAGEQERLAGFGLLNLRAGWEFSRNWNARLTVDNALDRDYVTARDSFGDFDYQNPGRSVHLSLRYGGDNGR